MGKSFEQTFTNDGCVSAATNSPIPGISPPHTPNNRFENNFWHRNPTRYGVAGLGCPYSYRIPLISMSDNTNNSHQHDPFANQFPTFGGQRKPATPASAVDCCCCVGLGVGGKYWGVFDPSPEGFPNTFADRSCCDAAITVVSLSVFLGLLGVISSGTTRPARL